MDLAARRLAGLAAIPVALLFVIVGRPIAAPVAPANAAVTVTAYTYDGSRADALQRQPTVAPAVSRPSSQRAGSTLAQWVSDYEGATGVAANAGRRAFEIHPRVLGQLDDPRLGGLRGKLTADDLQELAHNPSAQYLLDGATGNINVIQEVDGVILRITTPRDAFKIISVGRMRANQITNGLESGRFVPIGPGG